MDIEKAIAEASEAQRKRNEWNSKNRTTWKTSGYAVMSGNITDGFRFYGPFPDAVKAFDFTQEHRWGDMTTVCLIDPKLEWVETEDA